MRLALYQPDIPQNTGTILRLAACLGVGVDLIEPAGFDASDRALRRAGLDYLHHLSLERHQSWHAFCAATGHGRRGQDPVGDQQETKRLVLLTTKADVSYLDFEFTAADTLLLGRESAGVPDQVHATVDARIKVPLQPGLRSLNVAVAAAMVLGEAMRQTRWKSGVKACR